MQIGTAIVEKSVEFPEKINNGIPYDPAILLLSIRR